MENKIVSITPNVRVENVLFAQNGQFRNSLQSITVDGKVHLKIDFDTFELNRWIYYGVTDSGLRCNAPASSGNVTDYSKLDWQFSVGQAAPKDCLLPEWAQS